MTAIDKCIHGHDGDGGDSENTSTIRRPLQRPLQSLWWPASKAHGFPFSYALALQRYGTAPGRHKGLSRADKLSANRVLSSPLSLSSSISSISLIKTFSILSFHFTISPQRTTTTRQKEGEKEEKPFESKAPNGTTTT
ncbi:hypothetical protein ACA910_015369 [Epithemia clementina (nom. ined.)]